MVAEPTINRDDWWPCGCVKRNRKGDMTHIKRNSPARKKCRACGCTKAQHDKLAKEMKDKDAN